VRRTSSPPGTRCDAPRLCHTSAASRRTGRHRGRHPDTTRPERAHRRRPMRTRVRSTFSSSPTWARSSRESSAG
jgi:hypothetical protein